jgi:hypothetical protein
MAQPHWQFVDCYEDRTSVFRKLEDGSEWLEWTQQPLVALGGRMKWIDGRIHVEQPPVEAAPPEVHSTPLSRGFDALRKGDVKSLAQKIGRRIKG